MPKLRYKLWQNVWQDISLTQIAQKKGMKIEEIASADFYAMFYEKLKENHYRFQESWLNEKREYSNWLKEVVDRLTLNMKIEKPKLLSVGCGIGIVEEPFIRGGYDIELQECQKESYDYLNRGGILPKTWVTSTLDELPADTYDIVFSNFVMYALDDRDYKRQVANILRILKPHGKFIMIDTAAQWRNFLHENIINFSHELKKDKREVVFWGYIRSLKEHERLLKDLFQINREFWVAKTKSGKLEECSPATLLGFYFSNYKDAEIMYEGIICEKV
ncbi:MAG: class I SAM-dependent methyltransferase [Ruminococcus sp.]|nr:class I SAM-dependent methyltransferase [Ruminococcus sp.]